MTNLDKLKAEIADMSAEEFVHFVYNEPCSSVLGHRDGTISCRELSCWGCFVKWLNEESKESKEELK